MDLEAISEMMKWPVAAVLIVYIFLNFRHLNDVNKSLVELIKELTKKP